MDNRRILSSLSGVYAILAILVAITSLPEETISAPVAVNMTNRTYMMDLLGYVSHRECLFPIHLSDIGNNTPFYKELNRECEIRHISVSGTAGITRSTSICLIISDMVYSICNATIKFKSQDNLKDLGLEDLKVPLASLMKSQESMDSNEFCTGFMPTDNAPKIEEVRPEVQSDYSKFLLKESDVVAGTENQFHCSSVCQPEPHSDNTVKQTSGITQFKINPLCILFNTTSYTLRRVKDIFKQDKGKVGENPEDLPEVPNLSNLSNVLAIPPKKETSDLMAVEGEMGDDPDVHLDTALKDLQQQELNHKKDKDKTDLTNSKPEKSSSVAADPGSSLGSSVYGKPISTKKDEIAENDKGSVKNDKNQPVNAGASKSTSSTPSSASANIPEEVPPPPPQTQVENDKNSPPKPKASSPTLPKDANIGKQDGDKNKPSLDDNYIPKPDIADQGKTPVGNENQKPEGSVQGSEDYEDNPPSNLDGSMGGGDDDLAIPNEVETQDKKKPESVSKKKENANTLSVKDLENLDEPGGYFNYFLGFITILALCFIAFHNKRRLIAYCLEGKKPRGTRTRRRSSSNASSGASYRRLENNFE